MRVGRVLLLTLGVLAAVAAAEPAQVRLELSPRAPVKGVDVEATLVISLGGEGRQPPPVLRANVGTLGELERVGPGSFRARYRLPTTRFPEVAIIVAFAPWPHPQAVEGAVGVLRVPLPSAVEVPGTAEVGAGVTLTLAGRTFGPAEVGPDGTFRLPVVVPPGFGVAKTTTVDRARNRRTASLDLRLPPTDQLACVITPTRLPADGQAQARVLCATSDRYGAPTRGAKVQWRPGPGVLSAPSELGDGVTEWRWTVPRELGGGRVTLVATWKQGPVDSREELSLDLSQGPVASLTLDGEDLVAHQGGRWRLRARVRDAQGRPLAGVRLAGEGLSPSLSDVAGEASLEWLVPATEPTGVRQLAVVASGPPGKELARLSAWRTPEGLGVAAFDLSGLPVPGERIRVGAREGVTGPDGIAAFPGETAAARSAEWSGVTVTPPPPGAGTVATSPGVRGQVEVTVVPPVAVNVRLRREGGAVRWWLEAPSGELLAGREVEVRTGAGATRRQSESQATAVVSDGTLIVTDLATGNSAILEAAR